MRILQVSCTRSSTRSAGRLGRPGGLLGGGEQRLGVVAVLGAGGDAGGDRHPGAVGHLRARRRGRRGAAPSAARRSALEWGASTHELVVARRKARSTVRICRATTPATAAQHPVAGAAPVGLVHRGRAPRRRPARARTGGRSAAARRAGSAATRAAPPRRGGRSAGRRPGRRPLAHELLVDLRLDVAEDAREPADRIGEGAELGARAPRRAAPRSAAPGARRGHAGSASGPRPRAGRRARRSRSRPSAGSSRSPGRAGSEIPRRMSAISAGALARRASRPGSRRLARAGCARGSRAARPWRRSSRARRRACDPGVARASTRAQASRCGQSSCRAASGSSRGSSETRHYVASGSDTWLTNATDPSQAAGPRTRGPGERWREPGGGDAIIGAALEGLRRAAARGRGRALGRRRASAQPAAERLPEIPGLSFSARYLPGSAEAEIGGDWYDVDPAARRPGRRWRSATSSAAGSAPPPAWRTSRAPFAPTRSRACALRRARAHRRLRPGAASAAALRRLLYAVLDPEAATLRFASAGPSAAADPRPRGRGSISPRARPGSPLGTVTFPSYEESVVAARARARSSCSTPTASSSARHVRSPRGSRRWREAAAGLEPIPQSSAESCRGGCSEGRSRRRHRGAGDPPRAAAGGPARALAARRVALAGDRSGGSLGRWLKAAGAGETEIYETLVAVGEACANAIAHAYPAGEASFEVEATRSGPRLEVTVRDLRPLAAGPRRGAAARPDADGAADGRGRDRQGPRRERPWSCRAVAETAAAAA